MKLIYTNIDRLMVWNVKNKLEMAGFDCQIRHEYAAGGAGDIAPIETWPEVWLENDCQFEKAKTYIEQQILISNQSEQDWYCHHCGEKNPSSFDYCWNCQHDAIKD